MNSVQNTDRQGQIQLIANAFKGGGSLFSYQLAIKYAGIAANPFGLVEGRIDPDIVRQVIDSEHGEGASEAAAAIQYNHEAVNELATLLDVSRWTVERFVSNLAGQLITYRELEAYNDSVKSEFNARQYVKKRSGLEGYVVKPEFFQQFAKAFEGLAVVPDEVVVVKTDLKNYESSVVVRGSRIPFALYNETLRDALINMPADLKRNEEVTIKNAIFSAERGLPFDHHIFTEEQFQIVLDAHGAKIPEADTFSVVDTKTRWNSAEIKKDSEVELVSDKVVISGLTYEQAYEVQRKFKKAAEAMHTRDYHQNRVERLAEEIKQERENVQAAQDKFLAEQTELTKVLNKLRAQSQG